MADEQNKKQNQFQWLLIFIAIAIVFLGWLIFKNLQPSENIPAKLAGTETKPEPVENQTTAAVSINEVINKALTWGPFAQDWYGKEAPNFILNDLEGTKHSLTDYRGKNVIIVFWATWCGPCKQEIPHLIATKNRMGDKLAILAITNEENIEAIKNVASQMNVNYTILLQQAELPAPYNRVRAIPSSFFITPDGKIKLATEGALQMGDIKMIVNAE